MRHVGLANNIHHRVNGQKVGWPFYCTPARSGFVASMMLQGNTPAPVELQFVADLLTPKNPN